MNPELILLTTTTVILVLLGLSSIIGIAILRPTADIASVIKEISLFLGPTILLFISIFKNVQNSGDLKDLKVATNGFTDHQVKAAVAVATLTEQMKAAKDAADLAATTTAATAAALLKKEG